MIDKQLILIAVDRIPELAGAGVAYSGDGMGMVLRQSAHASRLETWVVVEEHAQPAAAAPSVAPPESHSTWNRLWPELLGLGINCASAGLTYVALAGEGAAAPLTGGSSLLLTGVTGAAALATSAQCGISIGRVYNAFTDPAANDVLDSSAWFQETGDILDAISLAGSVVSLGQAAQAALRLKGVTGRPMASVLRSMTRAERKQLAEELSGAASRGDFKRLLRAGKAAKIYSQAAITQGLKVQLYNAISSALSLGGSGYSGVMRKMVVHILQKQE